MPKESAKDLFDEIVLDAVQSVKTVIEREDLDEQLSPEDVHKIALAIEGGINNYVQFMIMVKKQARE